jgi:hypothetical protein
MIRNPEILRALEDEQARQTPSDFAANLRIADAMGEEAKLLGVLQRLKPLDGIEVAIRVARAVNSVH